MMIDGELQKMSGWESDTGETLALGLEGSYVPTSDTVFHAVWTGPDIPVTEVRINSQAKTLTAGATFQL